MAIYLEISAGTPIFGLWCPACLKPSGCEIPLNCLSPEGVSTFSPFRKCLDCDVPLP